MSNPTFQSVALLLSPYHNGTRRGNGVAQGPIFLQSHGIANAIRSHGISVVETELPEPTEAYEGDIARSFHLLRQTSEAVSDALRRGSFPILLSGNCTAAVGVASGLNAGLKHINRRGQSEGTSTVSQGTEAYGCVWFDAHDDFNTPDTLVSGYFDSMPISMLANGCWKTLLATIPGYEPMDVRRRLAHVGMRDVTEAERERVENAGFSIVWGGDDVAFERHLAQHLERLELHDSEMMVHVDLDCLDTSIGKANRFASPGGLLKEDLLGCLRRIVSTSQPTALTFASFDPSYEGAEKIAEVAVEAAGIFVEALQKRGILGKGE